MPTIFDTKTGTFKEEEKKLARGMRAINIEVEDGKDGRDGRDGRDAVPPKIVALPRSPTDDDDGNLFIDTKTGDVYSNV